MKWIWPAYELDECPPRGSTPAPCADDLGRSPIKKWTFIEHNNAVLKDIRVVLIRHESPMFDSATEWKNRGDGARKDDPDVIGKPKTE